MKKRLFSTIILMAGWWAVACLVGGDALGQTGAGSKPPESTSVENAAKQPLQTVQHVDLNRYMGQWYEIAAIPMFFERRCVAGAMAQYRLLPDGMVEVVNSCQTKSGERISSTGRARVVDSKTNAKLKVTFLNLLGWRFWAGGDYWIVDLDPDYQVALIGHPDRRYAWILSRTTALPPETLTRLQQVLRAKGYDPCRLMTMPQQGGLNAKRPLCP